MFQKTNFNDAFPPHGTYTTWLYSLSIICYLVCFVLPQNVAGNITALAGFFHQPSIKVTF